MLWPYGFWLQGRRGICDNGGKMRIVLDLPETLIARIRALLYSGRYESTQSFLFAAAENQLALEAAEFGEGEGAYLGSGAELLAMPGETPELAPEPPPSEKPLTWMVNRFLPLKVAVRVLTNLLLRGNRPGIPLVELEVRAGAAAREFGLFLLDIDRRVGRPPSERLSAGLPVGHREKRSLERFVHHFLCAHPTSGLRALGLASISQNLVGEQVVGLTAGGAKLASLTSPPLDQSTYTVALSSTETEFLRAQIASHAAGERKLLTGLLREMRGQPAGQEKLHGHLSDEYGWKGGSLATMAAGALARMRELGLVRSVGRGASVQYSLTPAGEEFLAAGG